MKSPIFQQNATKYLLTINGEMKSIPHCWRRNVCSQELYKQLETNLLMPGCSNPERSPGYTCRESSYVKFCCRKVKTSFCTRSLHMFVLCIDFISVLQGGGSVIISSIAADRYDVGLPTASIYSLTTHRFVETYHARSISTVFIRCHTDIMGRIKKCIISIVSL